jgi:hypothetical protein
MTRGVNRQVYEISSCLQAVVALSGIDDDRIRHEHEISFQICASSASEAVRMLTEFVADPSKNGGICNDCE